jgi:uncharacterized protein YdgA (DUF945 family)
MKNKFCMDLYKLGIHMKIELKKYQKGIIISNIFDTYKIQHRIEKHIKLIEENMVEYIKYNLKL